MVKLAIPPHYCQYDVLVAQPNILINYTPAVRAKNSFNILIINCIYKFISLN